MRCYVVPDTTAHVEGSSGAHALTNTSLGHNVEPGQCVCVVYRTSLKTKALKYIHDDHDNVFNLQGDDGLPVPGCWNKVS